MFILMCDYMVKTIKIPMVLQCYDMSMSDLLKLFIEYVKVNHRLSKTLTKMLKTRNSNVNVSVVYYVNVLPNNQVRVNVCEATHPLETIEFVIHVIRGCDGIVSYVEKPRQKPRDIMWSPKTRRQKPCQKPREKSSSKSRDNPRQRSRTLKLR